MARANQQVIKHMLYPSFSHLSSVRMRFKIQFYTSFLAQAAASIEEKLKAQQIDDGTKDKFNGFIRALSTFGYQGSVPLEGLKNFEEFLVDRLGPQKAHDLDVALEGRISTFTAVFLAPVEPEQTLAARRILALLKPTEPWLRGRIVVSGLLAIIDQIPPDQKERLLSQDGLERVAQFAFDPEVQEQTIQKLASDAAAKLSHSQEIPPQLLETKLGLKTCSAQMGL